MEDEIIKNLDLLLNLEELESEDIWDEMATQTKIKTETKTDNNTGENI